MSAKISVIVPVYCVEQYLHRCIDSILKQTFRELEIILVDDGSPDKCGEICDAYAAAHSNIHVVHKENGGLSSARNAGMAVACGEYIGFVDSDDYIVPEMFEKLYAAAVRSDADFVGCGYRLELGNGSIVDNKANLPTGVYGRETIVNQLAAHLFGDEHVLYPRQTVGYAWMNLYRGDTIRRHALTFCSEREYYHEDDVFLLDFMYHAQKAAFIDEPLYIYCFHEGSLIRSYRKNMWEMNKALLKKFRQFAEKYDIIEAYDRLVPGLKFDYALASVLNECKTGCPNPLRVSVGVIRDICTDPIVRDVFRSGEKRRCYITEAPCLFLMRMRMPLLICLLYRAYYRLISRRMRRKMAKIEKKTRHKDGEA